MLQFYILIIGFLLTIILTKATILIAQKRQLFEANDHRKLHTETVSALGGIPIFLGFWVMVVLFNFPVTAYLGILLGTGLLLYIGVEDDFKNTRVSKRFAAQIFAASIAYFSGFHFGWDGTWWLTLLNYGSTIFFIVLLINSYNLIDGINGLAGGLGFISMLLFGSLFMSIGLTHLSWIAFAYAIAIGGFLVFNFGKKATIFMGDNGSTVLGFLIGIFTLKMLQIGTITTDFKPLLLVTTAIAIPILDLGYVAFVRMAKGYSPFIGDRNHIHHLLTDSGLSHPAACAIIFCWLGCLLVLLSLSQSTFHISTLLLIGGSYFLMRLYYTKGKLFAMKRIIAGKGLEWNNTKWTIKILTRLF